MKRPERGFTLMETLVVLIVMALVIVMLRQATLTTTMASRSWHGMVDNRRDFQAVELALRHMIERMDPGVWPDPAVVSGTSAAIVFSTELPDPRSGATISADVRLEVENGDLVLLWTPRGHGVPLGEPPRPRRATLMGHVARIDLGYAPRGAVGVWSDHWTARALPGLVRIRIVSEGDGPRWPTIVARPRREQVDQ